MRPHFAYSTSDVMQTITDESNPPDRQDSIGTSLRCAGYGVSKQKQLPFAGKTRSSGVFCRGRVECGDPVFCGAEAGRCTTRNCTTLGYPPIGSELISPAAGTTRMRE